MLAKDLREGDVLTLADGTTATITKTYGEQLDEPVIVYNFEVKDFHTYYVTDTGVLVHNANKYATGNVKNSNGKDDREYTYDNGTYEKADYHSNQTTGRKNPAPQDGQFALDNSVPVNSSTTPRRVGLDTNGDFVVFDETTPGVFHGHLRSWNKNGALQGLDDNMKKALYFADYIKTPKGTKYKLTDIAKKLIGG